MAVDERDYMNRDEGEAGRDGRWYRRGDHGRGPSNEQFWKSVERGGGGGLGTFLVIVCVAIGGLAWYGHSSGVKIDQVANKLWDQVRGTVAKVRSTNSREQADVARCTGGSGPHRMAKQWHEAEQGMAGRVVEYVNGTGEQILVKVFRGEEGPLMGSVLMEPGDRRREQVLTANARLEVHQAGSRWCNYVDGWDDGTVTRIRGNVPSVGGVVTLLFERKQSGAGIVATVKQAAAQALAPRTGGYVEREATGRLRNGSAGGQAKESTRLAFQPSQSAVEAARRGMEQRVRQESAPQEVRETEHSEGDAALQAGVRIQDWRDVPQRDIRLVSNGGRHFLGGKLGEEDVQFELRKDELSVMGEAQAQRIGASRCHEGQWLVLGRYWTRCKKLVPSMQFGNVALENVLIAVVPGEHRPVLGRDLVGNARIYSGRDGNYVEVGQ